MTAAETADIRVISRPQRAAAEQYRDVVKPELKRVARLLGFSVGRYTNQSGPSVWLTPQSSASPFHGIMLYLRGREVEAGIRSKAWKQQSQTPMGQIAHALSFGVHEAYGHSDPSAQTFAARVESAIRDAVRNFENKEVR
jgi:hypothetical protein